MKYLKLLIFAFLFFYGVNINSEIFACSPASNAFELKTQVKNAENIFVGKVLKTKDFSEDFGSFEITVQITEVIKSTSKKGETVIVSTTSSSASCGYDNLDFFKEDGEILFFTNFNFETSHLAGNQKIKNRQAKIDEIKKILNQKEEKVITPPFIDVDYGNNNKDAIDYIREQGIVNGYEDGTFKPQNTINRAEFTKIIVVSQFHELEIKHCPLSSLKFSDVKKTDWFAPFICVAKVNGLIKGYDDGTFKPNKEIVFTESAKIISQAFDLPKMEGRTWYEGFFLNLEENSAIPPSIKKAGQSITRGEMAEMIYRLKANITNLETQRTEILIPECPGDLKICEDGSMVKRVLPNCSFETCGE